MASEEISHKGKVLSVRDGVVSVEIVSSSACSACHASGLCGMSESVRKTVEVRDAAVYSPGQEVEVCLARRMGMKAVLLSYVIPVVILMIIILSLLSAGISELAAGLLSVAGIAVYYGVLWLFRGSLKEEYVFYIRKRII